MATLAYLLTEMLNYDHLNFSLDGWIFMATFVIDCNVCAWEASLL